MPISRHYTFYGKSNQHQSPRVVSQSNPLTQVLRREWRRSGDVVGYCLVGEGEMVRGGGCEGGLNDEWGEGDDDDEEILVVGIVRIRRHHQMRRGGLGNGCLVSEPYGGGG